MFHAKLRIRHFDNFPRTNQATSTELYNSTQKCVENIQIQQYIGFFVIAGLSELFTTCIRPANIRPAMRDY